MAEITAKAYQDLRDYITANWKYIELRDEEGAPVIRLGVGDPRVTWTNVEGAQTLELTITIREVQIVTLHFLVHSLPVLYTKVASGEKAYSVESFSAFTMEDEGDNLQLNTRYKSLKLYNKVEELEEMLFLLLLLSTKKGGRYYGNAF